MTSSLSADWPVRPPRPLPPHEAHLYFMRLDGFTAVPPALYDLLNDQERARCARYLALRNRIESAAARALTRAALSRHAEVAPRAWTFAATERGKPQIAGPLASPPLRFNVSHTQGLVACLVAAEREVGVDVEFLGSPHDITLLSQRCLSAAEKQALWALPAPAQARRFLVHWTLKEAYLKARGIGLGLPLAEITILTDDDPQTLSGPPTNFALGPGVGDQPARWQLARCHLTTEHVAAVVIERTDSDVTLHLHEVMP